MINSKLVASMILAGMVTSFNVSAVTTQSIGQNDDYDVTSVLSARSLGQITTNEEVKINSPDDYNVTEVYRAKRVLGQGRNHMGHMMHASRSSLDNIDDY